MRADLADLTDHPLWAAETDRLAEATSENAVWKELTQQIKKDRP
jgi:hypothetical protein